MISKNGKLETRLRKYWLWHCLSIYISIIQRVDYYSFVAGQNCSNEWNNIDRDPKRVLFLHGWLVKGGCPLLYSERDKSKAPGNFWGINTPSKESFEGPRQWIHGAYCYSISTSTIQNLFFYTKLCSLI